MAEVLERYQFGEEPIDGGSESYNNEDVIAVLANYKEHIGNKPRWGWTEQVG